MIYSTLNRQFLFIARYFKVHLTNSLRLRFSNMFQTSPSVFNYHAKWANHWHMSYLKRKQLFCYSYSAALWELEANVGNCVITTSLNFYFQLSIFNYLLNLKNQQTLFEPTIVCGLKWVHEPPVGGVQHRPYLGYILPHRFSHLIEMF